MTVAFATVLLIAAFAFFVVSYSCAGDGDTEAMFFFILLGAATTAAGVLEIVIPRTAAGIVVGVWFFVLAACAAGYGLYGLARRWKPRGIYWLVFTGILSVGAVFAAAGVLQFVYVV